MEIISFEELDSTNDYLKSKYSEYNDFTVIRAIKQINGRGRFDRVWESKNDLTFSILFTRSLPHHFIAPLSISLSLNYFGIDSSIKWPNDVLVNNEKISGVLIEKIFENKNSIDIVGIGINIEKRDNYTYLDKYKKISINSLLDQILKTYEFLSNIDLIDLKRYYLNLSTITGKNIIYNNISYIVLDINDLGELVIRNNNDTRTLNANEINYNTMKITG